MMLGLRSDCRRAARLVLAVLMCCAVAPQVAHGASREVRERRVAWILFNTDGKKPVSHDRLRDVFHAGVNVDPEGQVPDFSVQAWFDTVSRGGARLVSDIGDEASTTDDVFGWYTVKPLEDDPCGDIAEAVRRARADGFHDGRYDHVVHVWSHRDECPYNAAGAVVGGRDVFYPVLGERSTVRPSALIHELGHNLGLPHAAAQECEQDGQRVTLSEETNCDTSGDLQYRDFFDIMGPDYTFRHINAYFQVRLGWLPQSAVHEVPASETTRTIEVGAFEAPGGRPHALQIPLERYTTQSGAKLFLYLEFRTTRDYDRNTPPEVCAETHAAWRTDFDRTEGVHEGLEEDSRWEGAPGACDKPVTNSGVLMRTGLDFDVSVGRPGDLSMPGTGLLDATPETGPTIGFGIRNGFEDAALPLGRTFTYAPEGLSITVDEIVSNPDDPHGPPVAAKVTVKRFAPSA